MDTEHRQAGTVGLQRNFGAVDPRRVRRLRTYGSDDAIVIAPAQRLVDPSEQCRHRHAARHDDYLAAPLRDRRRAAARRCIATYKGRTRLNHGEYGGVSRSAMLNGSLLVVTVRWWVKVSNPVLPW